MKEIHPNPFVLVIVWFVTMSSIVFPVATTINHIFFGVGSIRGELVILLSAFILAYVLSLAKRSPGDDK